MKAPPDVEHRKMRNESKIKIGQIWCENINLRKIRILGQEADGRWRAEVVTNIDGFNYKGGKPFTKLLEKTLIGHYKLVQAAA